MLSAAKVTVLSLCGHLYTLPTCNMTQCSTVIYNNVCGVVSLLDNVQYTDFISQSTVSSYCIIRSAVYLRISTQCKFRMCPYLACSNIFLCLSVIHCYEFDGMSVFVSLCQHDKIQLEILVSSQSLTVCLGNPSPQSKFFRAFVAFAPMVALW